MNDPHVTAMLATSDRLHERYVKLRTGVDARGLNWRPRPDVWSIGQCFHHIITSEATYLPQLTNAITRRDRPAANGYRFRPTWFGKWFARQVGPEGRRMKAPIIFRPAVRSFDLTLWDEFDAHEQTVRQRIASADGLDLNRIIMVSPVSRFFRFNLGDCFAILLGHRDRHLRQAERLESQLNSSHG